MMRSHFLSTCLIHKSKEGSVATFFKTAYSAICTKYNSLTFFNWFHVDLTSLHWIHISRIFVLSWWRLWPLDMWMNASSYLISIPSFLWIIISLKRANLIPSWSTCANKLLEMLFAEISAMCTSAYSTLYILVSRIGLSDAMPIGRTSFYFILFFTVENYGPSYCISKDILFRLFCE